MKRILILMSLSSAAYAGGDQPVPPPLPPAMPTTETKDTQTTTTTTTSIPLSPAPSDAVCVGAKIICQCTAGKPKTIIKIVEKPVTKTITKLKLVEVPKEVTKEVVREVPGPERVVYKDNPDDYAHHEFSLMLGGGPSGVDMGLYGGQYEFKKGYGATAGAMYQYGLTKNFAIGAAAFLNESYFGVLTFKK